MAKDTYYIGRQDDIREWADMHGLAYLDGHHFLDNDKWNNTFVAAGTVATPRWVKEADARAAM